MRGWVLSTIGLYCIFLMLYNSLMADTVCARLIVPSDKDQFVELMKSFIQEYIAMEKTYPVHYDPRVGEVYWQDIIDHPDSYYVVVAELDTKLVGFCVGEIKKSQGAETVYADHDLHGGVWDLSVDAQYRSRGIGQLMLDKMAEVFVEHGCKDMVLNGVDLENTGARKLYERLGFKPWNIKYYKKIG